MLSAVRLCESEHLKSPLVRSKKDGPLGAERKERESEREGAREGEREREGERGRERERERAREGERETERGGVHAAEEALARPGKKEYFLLI